MSEKRQKESGLAEIKLELIWAFINPTEIFQQFHHSPVTNGYDSAVTSSSAGPIRLAIYSDSFLSFPLVCLPTTGSNRLARAVQMHPSRQLTVFWAEDKLSVSRHLSFLHWDAVAI